MAQHDDGVVAPGGGTASASESTAAGTSVERVHNDTVSPGLAVVRPDRFANPGFPPHRARQTDLDPEKQKRASRQVSGLFVLSMIGSLFAVVAYFVWPIIPGDMTSVRMNNLFLGLGITLALLGIGIGAVHWAKSLMSDAELIEERHGTRGTEETRAKAVEVFTLANQESGFGRRTLIRNTLIGAVALTPIPAIAMFRDLAPAGSPVPLFKHTMWEAGTRLARDPDGTLIRAADMTIGSAVHVIPEGLNELHEHKLEEKAKAAVLLMRLEPGDLNETEERAGWSYSGIVAYSKICTHVGCPVALYEQQTHHLLCPCHQSEFDVADGARVIFGPAKRPLPQLPIAVDSEGYLIAQSDFLEPVGPSFWEREL